MNAIVPAASALPKAGAARRRLISVAATLLVLPVLPRLAQAATILAVRTWPADEYTRVTLELDSELKAEQFTLENPHRLVVDIEGLTINAALNDLVSKVRPDDPYIQSLRVAQNRPNVVRMVFDLKQAVAPQVFTLKPVADYQYRLVLDLYPKVAQDPLIAVINKQGGPDVDDPLARILEDIQRNPGSKNNPPPEPPLARGQQPAAPIPTPAAARLRRTRQAAHADHRAGPRPRRRGSGRDRQQRPAREGRGAAHRAPAQGADRQPAEHARLPDARRRLLRAVARARAEARRAHADLFVSIHADAWIKPSANGSSVFALSQRAPPARRRAGWPTRKTRPT